MKYINALLCVMMLLFIAVQYNDPDGLMWAVIYVVPAIWAGLAAFRLKHLMSPRTLSLLGISVCAALALTAYYWPTTPEFWLKAVYWKTETAREGMGMMIATVVLLISATTILMARKKYHLNQT